jgi:Flp pilus assembly protein protease CpaA
LKPAILAGAVLLSILAGWMDLRSRRIPNWLTLSGAAVGVMANTALGGVSGLKTSLLGLVVGLGLLLPFVLLRSLGAGDWKLAGALGLSTKGECARHCAISVTSWCRWLHSSCRAPGSRSIIRIRSKFRTAWRWRLR